MSRHGSRFARGLSVRTLRARVGASDEGQGAARVPEVQESLLEHAAPEQGWAAQGDAQMKRDPSRSERARHRTLPVGIDR